MLEVSRIATIGGDNCPVVGEYTSLFSSHIDHWLNGYDHSRLEKLIGLALLNIVKHLWVFVHTATNAVSTVLAHYREACRFNIVLYRPTDMVQSIARTSCRDTPIERLLRHLEQALHLRRDGAYRYGDG